VAREPSAARRVSEGDNTTNLGTWEDQYVASEKCVRCGRALALCVALGGVPASADDDNRIKTVFVIAMENHSEADVFRGLQTESAGIAIEARSLRFCFGRAEKEWP